MAKLSEAQAALLKKLASGRYICHAQDGEMAWLNGANNRSRWSDLNWKDLAVLRDNRLIESLDPESRFFAEHITDLGRQALSEGNSK